MILSVKNLDLVRAEHVLHHSLSFCVKSGQGLMITGANGSGKTTLLYYLCGLIPSTAVFIEKKAENFSFFLPCELALFEMCSVSDNIVHFAKLLGCKEKQRIEEGIEYFDLSSLLSKRVMNLSTGQKRRVSLVRLFLTQSKLWLLDEPDQGLDEGFKCKLDALLKRHIRSSGAFVMASHSMNLKGYQALNLG